MNNKKSLMKIGKPGIFGIFTTLQLILTSFTLTFGQENDRLSDRGAPEVLNGSQLKYIGMPIGGLASGQVYLGGDGQLWYWDVFNINRIDPQNPGAGDKFYLNPMTQDRRFEQGFAIRINKEITSIARSLNNDGFSDITFRGEYPIGKVNYKDANFPVSVSLEAFTPFIPTDFESSGFPAVIMEYQLKNKTDKTLELEIMGWLQNTANYFTAEGTSGKHINKIIKSEDVLH
ncbi:GH116 family glycosyl-hydrolase [Fulvivirgaceae bacterium BMA10]|uniref:GH116 family glycosyl-hydrolase n=1 Tax=Splendidivirga corallicola TaxID=3051826 RepID=A0ABT8KU32_9BACT|nr:GH116 family glycosyl-hydrolase [Fulvivirgaceae bacterium BMA10]